ncbi:MAG: glycosyltransferase family 32 protein [Candidatus Udaeobacter sp.]
MHDKIPARIIHVSCPPAGESEELSLLHQAALANARALHPNFDHVLFGNREMEEFVRKEFPEFRAAMASFSQRIQRVDFFRYLAVYRLGGFYFDLDVLLARSIRPLLDHTCVLSFEELTINKFLRLSYGMDWEVANYGFGATPQNSFIGALIENCLRFAREPSWGYQMMQGVPRAIRDLLLVPFTTGPGMVSRTLAENPHLAKDVTILFPEDVCDERTWHQFGNFGIHLQQGAWRSRHSYLRRRLANLWESSMRRRLHRESRAKGKSRSLPLTRAVGVQKSQFITKMLEAQ